MRHLIFIFLLILCSQIGMSQSQNEDKMKEAIENMEDMMDTLDQLKLIDEDLLKLFEESFGNIQFDTEMHDLLDSFDFKILEDLNFESYFEQLDTMNFNSKSYDNLLQKSLKLFQEIDLSELENIFKSFEMQLEDLEIRPEQDSIHIKGKPSKRI